MGLPTCGTRVIRRLIGLLLFACVASAAPAVAIAAITTTTALSLGSMNSVTGDVRLEFGVSGCAPSGAPFESGTVQIFDGATPVYSFVLLSSSLTQRTVGPCTGGSILSNGSPPSIAPTLSGVSPGTHTYTAVYSGDAFYASSTSSPITVTIPPRPTAVATTTTLSLGSMNSVTGDVRLEFRVSGCAPSGAPFESGTVQIFDGATPVYSFTLLSSGLTQGTVGPCTGGSILANGSPPTIAPTLSGVSPGTHTYIAVYSGDAFYASSTSSPITVTIPPRPTAVATTTTLNLGSMNSVTGDVRLEFRVSGCAPSGAPFESGTVQIFDGATPVYSFTLLSSGLTQGTVGPCTGGSILANGSPPTIAPTLSGVSPGTHTYIAVYSGDAFYASSTSPAITVTIPPRPTAVATTTTLSLGSMNSVTGDVRLEFRVSGCAPSGAPFESGTVQIFDGATPVYSFTLLSSGLTQGTVGPCTGGSILANGSPPTIAPTLSGVSPGTHTYTAVYSGDAFYASSTSSPITVTIPPRPTAVATTTTLNLGSMNSVTGDVRLEFRVSGCAPSGAPFESGTVQIFDGATPVYSFTLLSSGLTQGTVGPCTGGSILANGSPPTIAPTLSGVSPGTHTYTAVYSGDAFYASSTSAPVIVNVTALPTVPPGQSFGGPTATTTGNATLRVSGGGALCGFTRAAFVPVSGNPFSPPPNSAPPGLVFAHGLIGFVTSGCTPGATLTFTLTLPTASADVGAYWKYGPTPDQSAPHWYQLPASVQNNVVTFSITDGGLGDDDLTANGTVVDIGGPTIESAQAVPTASNWTLLFLTLLLGIMAAYAARINRSPPAP